MKISTKSRYGLRAVFDIAYHSAGLSTQVKEISARQAISPRYIEQIFQKLKKAGIIKSIRGPSGGYYLAKKPTRSASATSSGLPRGPSGLSTARARQKRQKDVRPYAAMRGAGRMDRGHRQADDVSRFGHPPGPLQGSPIKGRGEGHRQAPDVLHIDSPHPPKKRPPALPTRCFVSHQYEEGKLCNIRFPQN